MLKDPASCHSPDPGSWQTRDVFRAGSTEAFITVLTKGVLNNLVVLGCKFPSSRSGGNDIVGEEAYLILED